MRLFKTVPLLGAASLFFACSTDSPVQSDVRLTAAESHMPANEMLGHLTICKEGSKAEFQVTRTPVPLPDPQVHIRAAGECFTFTSDPGPDQFTVYELTSEPGYRFDRLVVQHQIADVYSETTLYDPEIGPLQVGNDQGWVLIYYNERVPPPVGGQGCTPGYWKQPQHFDSWVGYAPSQLFSTVFDNAFPGKTLLEVAQTGGNGNNEALGRHAVAALLNSSNSAVSYDLTSAQVIAAFNGAWMLSKSSSNAVKDQLEAYNQQGCPLN